MGRYVLYVLILNVTRNTAVGNWTNISQVHNAKGQKWGAEVEIQVPCVYSAYVQNLKESRINDLGF